LPFADRSFDMVTCQTVLIHVRDAKQVLREMLRVLKAGGLLAVAEPKNLINELVLSNANSHSPADDLADLVRFHLLCERGKAALGLGYNSVGDLLPGYFAELGLREVQVYLDDRPVAVFPPYASPAQQACLKQWMDWAERDFWIWDREETRRYFLAGGGAPDQFDSYWAKARQAIREFVQAVRAKTYHSAGGLLLYLVSGRKA
jgi:SAM-dependent methyltransferase